MQFHSYQSKEAIPGLKYSLLVRKQMWFGVKLLPLLLLVLAMAAPQGAASAQFGDRDGDGIPDNFDRCPDEFAYPSSITTGAELGCPALSNPTFPTPIPQPTAIPQPPYVPPPNAPPPNTGNQCLIAFNGTVTYTQPSTSAPIMNSRAVPGTYVAAARTPDNLWWLLNGTDWVQGGVLTPDSCYALPVTGGYNPPPNYNPQPVQRCTNDLTHTVSAGETLFGISQRYGVSLQTVASANNIGADYIIYTGQQLLIPCPTANNPQVVAQPAATQPVSSFIQPTTPITRDSAVAVQQLFQREFEGFPADMSIFGPQGDEALAFLTTKGLVQLFPLNAPDVMPGSITGTAQTLYQFDASSTGVISFAELSSEDNNNSLINVEGILGVRENRVSVPLMQGVVLDVAATPGLLLATAGPVDPNAASGQLGVSIWGLVEAVGSQIAFLPHQAPVSAMTLTPDYTKLVTSSVDGTIQAWDMTNPNGPSQIASFNDGQGSTSPIGSTNSIAISPDGTLIAVGGDDGKVRIWDVITRSLLTTVPYDSETAVLAVAFSPDGSVLATGGGLHPALPGVDLAAPQDNSIHLWSVEALRNNQASAVGVLIGHSGAVMGLAFNVDGKMLISTSADSTWRIWGIGA